MKVASVQMKECSYCIHARGRLTFCVANCKTIISNCEVDPVAALLVFAEAHEINWTNLEAIGWSLYDFTLTMTIGDPE